MNLSELTKYIRFQLAQLRIDNKHHDFEHLSRHFTRLRLCPNVIPATGPVGTGGDQGKDFESYISYLNSTSIVNSTFIGEHLTKKIVGCCSLQQEINNKIKSDIKTVYNNSIKIDLIYYFCESDLPVSERHKLQNWERKNYNVEIEIFDGNTISEQLTDEEIFWIAEEYLDVSSDLFPKSNKLGATYNDYKERWLINDELIYSYEDFYQLKYGLRKATFNSKAKPDLLGNGSILDDFAFQ